MRLCQKVLYIINIFNKRASQKQVSVATYSDWWVGVAAMSLTIRSAKDWNWLGIVACTTEVGSLQGLK